MKRQKLRVTVRNDSSNIVGIEGSDIRIAGGVTGECKLCGEIRLLQLGHIIPRWMYRWAKAEHKMIGIYKSLGMETEEQDGNKHYLFCNECEKYFGKAEWYASILMAGTASEWQRLGLTEKDYCIYGIDYDLARRFVLGIAYKAHLAPSPPFHRIKFDEYDFGLLRQLLLSSDYDDLTLPIIALRYESYTPEANAKAIIISSYMPNSGPVPIFSSLAAGWDWFIFFNGKGDIGNAEFLRMRLSPGLPLYAPVNDIIEHPFVRRGL